MEIWSASENETIAAFLQYRNALQGTEYKVTRKPDEAERNANACDAIATCSTGARPLAIEHTKVDAHRNQTEDDYAYLKLVTSLDSKMRDEQSLKGVILEFKNTCPPKGVKWEALGATIFKFVADQAANFADKSTKDMSGEFPIDFLISKNLAGPTGAVRSSQAKRVKVEFPQIIVEAIQTKIVQLRTEKAEDYDRILLLQMRDPNMYSAHEVPSIFRDQVLPNVEDEVADLSEIWMMLTMPDNKNKWMTARLYPFGGNDCEVHFTDSASLKARFL